MDRMKRKGDGNRKDGVEGGRDAEWDDREKTGGDSEIGK